MAIANVAFTDPVDLWRVRTNQTIKVVNDIENGVHPLANTVRAAANTANNVSNSAANIAYTMVTSNTAFMNQLMDAANTLISTIYTDIYQDSNASFLRSNAALITANTAMIIANSAFATANNFVANSSNIIAGIILSNTATQNTLNTTASSYVQGYLANVSFSTIFNTANGAFEKANSANVLASSVYGVANNIWLHANTARNSANTVFDATNAAFAVANTGGGATAIAIAAYGQANTANAAAYTALFNTDSLSLGQTTTNDIVTAAFGRANTAFSITNTAYGQANAAYSQANAVSLVAVSAFAKANTGGGGANVAIINDTVTNINFYPTMTRQSTGNASNLSISTTQLYFNPSTGTLNSTIFNSISDENVKENIQRVESALDLINQLNGVTFNWKSTNKASAGVIAQNLMNVVPCLVDTDNKPLSVNYDGLSALFIEAIKELNNEVKSIKTYLKM